MENVLADSAPLRLRRPAHLLRLASDERLVALVRGGDEGAFEALYDRHHPAILGFCRHMLGTREEAEDAVQHTFLAAFRDLVGSDKPIELRPWLFAIARNRCLSLLRARRPHAALERAEPATDGLAATVERREDLRELLADLARLPEDQRAALLLSELGALDHAGIATVLGCPREKVKALVFQARTSLAASREARATPCDDIRVELATASGAALRRGPLRRHLRACAGCRAFKAEVATQRGMFALALPVVPTVALKAGVLSGTGAATASGGAATASGCAAAAGAATAGVTSGASGGTLGGLVGAVVSTGAGKVAVSIVVAGAVAGGGTLTERIERGDAAPHATPPSGSTFGVAPQAPFAVAPMRRGAAESAPADRSAAPALGGQSSPSDPAAAPGASSPAHGTPSRHAEALPAAGRAPAHATPLPTLAAGEVRRHPATPPPTPVPAPPQAQGKQPSSAPPAGQEAPPATGQPAGGGPPASPPGGGKPSESGKPSPPPTPPAKAERAPTTGKPPQAAPSADKVPPATPPASRPSQSAQAAGRSPHATPPAGKSAAPPAGTAGSGSAQPAGPSTAAPKPAGAGQGPAGASAAPEGPPAGQSGGSQAQSGGSHGESGRSRGRAR